MTVPDAFEAQATAIPRRTSLVDEVVRVLCARLIAGYWKEVLPGEHELCAELRVSRMTLRAALDQLAKARWLAKGGHGRRHRVLPQPPRKNPVGPLAGPNANEIRVLSFLPAEHIVGVMQTALACLKTTLAAVGYVYSFTHPRPPAGRRGVAELARLTSRPGVAGWVLYCASEAVQQWFAAHRLPCIVLGGCFSGIGLLNVEFDARAIGRHAGSEFLRRGHTRLAIVRPTLLLAGDEACAVGLSEAASRFGCPAEVIDLAYEPTLAGIRLVMERTLGRPHPPTAFLVAQPNFVWPVISCLQKAGRQIPRDAVVISRGDDLFLETAIPTVARYVHDGARLGHAAARLLLGLLKPSIHPPASRRLMPKFIGGETLGWRRSR